MKSAAVATAVMLAVVAAAVATVVAGMALLGGLILPHWVHMCRVLRD